ncbi:MAG: hypothetical protein E7218_00905 [Anaerofustis stercorihominis]|nr:hypothetical protein [Anaerofustis stercorihominis]
MSDKLNTVTCSACGLQYSEGEKRCPLCGVKNRKFNIFVSLTSKKEDPYGERDSRQNSKKENSKPAAKARPAFNTTRNTSDRKTVSDASADTIVKIIVSVLAVMFTGPFGVFIAAYILSRHKHSR